MSLLVVLRARARRAAAPSPPPALRLGALRFGVFGASLLGASALAAVWASSASGQAEGAEAAVAACEEARLLSEAWRHEEAAAAYRRAIDADPANYEAHVRYQEEAFAAGRARSELIRAYDAMIAALPDEGALRLHRLRLDPVKERQQQLEAMRRRDPGAVDVLLELARLAGERGERDRALQALEQAAAGDPERLDVVLALVRAESAAGREEQALGRLLALPAPLREQSRVKLQVARLALARGQTKDALLEADAVLAACPGSAGAVLVRSEALVAAEMVPEAIDALRAALESTGKALPVRLALADLVVRGTGKEALEEAAALYQGVLEESPRVGRALYGLAWARELQGKTSEAETLYRRVAAEMPGTAAAVHSIGFALLRQERDPEAQAQFKKAIELDAGFVPAYLGMAASLIAEGKHDEAVRWYERLLALPGHKDDVRALVGIAFEHEQRRAFPKAEQLFRRARELQPRDADVAVWLADNLYFQEKWKLAERAYNEAIDLDRTSFMAWRGLGRTRLRLGRAADGVIALEEARKLEPDDLDLLLDLADLYEGELDDLEKALAVLEDYQKRGGTDSDVGVRIADLRKRLEKKRR